MFEKFIIELKKEFEKPLPGIEAQYRLAPTFRGKPSVEYINERKPKKAGVMLLLYPIENMPYFALILRNKYPGVHSGQIGFPGGKLEANDKNLIDAALRETEEEIGVSAQEIELLGQLTQIYIPPSNFQVLPSVGFCSFRPSFKLEAKEVQALIEIKVEDLLNPENISETEVDVRGLNRKVPCFKINGNIIWGATAIILSEFMAMLEK